MKVGALTCKIRVATSVVLAALVAVPLTASATSHRPQDDASRVTASEIKADESIIFFRTAAWLDEGAEKWHLPIHGWVYEPQNSRVRKAAVGKVLKDKYGLTVPQESEELFASRVNWLLADSERGRTVYIRLADTTYEMPRTGPDGHFQTTLVLTRSEVQRLARNGSITYSAKTSQAIPRQFTGVIELVPPTGLMVISDIDDTVKVTGVTDRRELLTATLLREFEPVPGMAEKYQQWRQAGAAIKFVSSSPWQLYAALDGFAMNAGFPAASFDLKSVRFRDKTLLNLLKKGTETKPAQIRPILENFPGRHVVLIGDTGEQDPEVYAELMRTYPNQIIAIYLRNVTDAARGDRRFVTAFKGLPKNQWVLFTEPVGLQLPKQPSRDPI